MMRIIVDILGAIEIIVFASGLIILEMRERKNKKKGGEENE